MNQAQKDFVELVSDWLRTKHPTFASKLSVSGRVCADLNGRGRVVCEFPLAPDDEEACEIGEEATIRIAKNSVRDRFNRGDRDTNATAPAYLLGWIEPVIPWEGGEIVWRPTVAGKAAGLK